MAADCQSIEAAATTINWVGYWGAADFEGELRGDALQWSGEEVRRFVASGGRDEPGEVMVDTENSACPYTGAGAGWNVTDVPQPWWVEAQFHTEGPGDDVSIPRKLEGWYRVEDFNRDGQTEVGEDLNSGDLCFVEKLWSDRIRVFKAGPKGLFGEVPLQRVCDLQLMMKEGTPVGSRWDLLRDNGEGGDDPDEIRVGQQRTLLGGEYGALRLRGIECEVVSYVEWMDRWTVEIPVKDHKGKNLCIAVIPSQLREPRLPREPKPNGHVNCDLSLNIRSLELSFRAEELPKEDIIHDVPHVPPLAGAGGGGLSIGGDGGAFLLAGALLKAQGKERHPEGMSGPKSQTTIKHTDKHFRLRIRYVSRVRPGGRVWTACEESMYKYVEVRYIAQGDYGLVFRVLRMVDHSKKILENDEEDPHLVLDVPRGSEKSAITKAYRNLARQWHPDKVPEEEREQAIVEFRKIHQAYENLLADPEKSSDLLVLKMQHPNPARKSKRIPVSMGFRTEARCLSLVTQLRLPNISKLVEVGPDNEFLVTWPYVAESLMPHNECDGVNQVDRVDLVRQGWSDYSRSRKSAQKIIVTMMSMIRHDVMIVDPIQNILVDRESGEPLFIDLGRGETAGSIYTTRIKTFMKKVLQLLVRSISKSSYDIAARFIRDLEDTVFSELERWQDEKTRDQKKALALVTTKTKWQEGIEQCREIWTSEDENPFRKMFKDQKGICPIERKLRAPKVADDAPDSDDEKAKNEEGDKEDDPEGYCDADVSTLTPVQALLRSKRKKGRRAALTKEKPNVKIKIDETLPDGKLGIGLDDADEDHRGVIVVQVDKKVRKFGWEEGDRIIELNGKEIDEWDDFKMAWDLAQTFSSGVVFGIIRDGAELPPEPDVPKCLHCTSKGSHLQKCTNWKPMPEGKECVYFCGRDCQKEAWKAAKRAIAAQATE